MVAGLFRSKLQYFEASPIHTWVGPVGPRRVVEDEDGGEIGADGGEVLGVGAEVEGAVLAVVTAPKDAAVLVQLVRHRSPVDLHAGREHDELVPL